MTRTRDELTAEPVAVPQVSPGDDTNEPPQFDWLIGVAAGTMLVQNFVITNAVKGLTLSACAVGLALFRDLLIRPARLQPVLLFAVIFGGLQLASQLANALWAPELWRLPAGLLISGESAGNVLFRQSLITQTVYVLVGVAFYFAARRLLESYYGQHLLLRVTRWGIIAFVGYGLFVFFGYLVVGQDLDFLSNRLTGLGDAFGGKQVYYFGSLEILRLESLAAEPSMFAYFLVPFAVLYYCVRDRMYLLLLFVLLLSTSTTALLGLGLFAVFNVVLHGRGLPLLAILALLVTGGLLFFPEETRQVWAFTVSKVTLSDGQGVLSGIERFANFKGAMGLFASYDPMHWLVGCGFGTIRSTDGFSTLLVNVGVGGTLVFLWFFLFPVFALRADSGYRRGLRLALIVTVILALISVPEFYFLHLWLLAALAWHEWNRQRHIEPVPVTA